jgi:hypothetical protein
MSAEEYAEWLVYWQVEPWGDWRADLRSAIVASLLRNAHRAEGERAFSIPDFMPFDRAADTADAEPEEDEAWATLKRLFPPNAASEPA